MTVQFGKRLSLHLQLHLRVFFEHLRIALPEQLRDPLVRHTPRTEPGSVRGAEIIDAEVSDTCPSRGWPEGKNDILPWWNYFLSLIRGAYRDFEMQVESSSARPAKGDLVRPTVLAQVEEFTLTDLSAQLTRLRGSRIKTMPFGRLQHSVPSSLTPVDPPVYD